LEGIFGRDRATGAAAVSGCDAHEQVNEKQEDQSLRMDEFDLSANPMTNGSPPPQGAASSSEAAATSGKISSKKKKQMSILERMAEHVQVSTEAQGKHVHILADAISGFNDKFKMHELPPSLLTRTSSLYRRSHHMSSLYHLSTSVFLRLSPSILAVHNRVIVSPDLKPT
ncbi:hypothetical protein S83_060209, partial [Arachis hypogaea]